MSEPNKPTVLIFASHYLPGYKAGGPIKSIANAVESLGDEFNFVVITRDRDLGSSEPYEIAKSQQTVVHGRVRIRYLAPGLRCVAQIRQLILQYRPDVIYLNSLFDPLVTTVPLMLIRLGLVPQRFGIAIAPRGEFSPGAMALKAIKKRIFLSFSKRIDLYRAIIWQATAEKEVSEIKSAVAPNVPIILVIPDPPATPPILGKNGFLPKQPAYLNVVFLARVSRMKNLDGALRILMGVREKIHFSIYGPAEDAAYWAQCQELIRQLPDNVSVKYFGAITPDRVTEVFLEQDLLLLPTLGENFGHVICEAWSSGCPVLISDQTPWRDLQHKGVGWDVPLNLPEKYREVIDLCARMKPEDYRTLRKRAREYAEELIRTNSSADSLRKLFAIAMEHGRDWSALAWQSEISK